MILIASRRRPVAALSVALCVATLAPASAQLASPTPAGPSRVVPGPPAQVQAPPASPSQRSLMQEMQDAFTGIARSAEPFVVNIQSAHSLTSSDPDLQGPTTPTPKAPKIPGAPSVPELPSPFPKQEQATGSGVIIRSDGYVLTNDHVVEGSPYVTVTLSDGQEFRGKVTNDFRSDLAVVKIDPGSTKLTVATFANSDMIQPGQWAIAIGSPFDLQNTMTVGVISAIHRHQTIGDDAVSTRYYPDLVQTDAAINPGNSGGPLLNIDGQVVGINVAIESPVEGSAGVGFAIPANTATYVANQLIQNGKVMRGYLGLAPEDLTPARQQEFGVSSGAYVVQVDEDSPAGKAGMHATDIITKFNGTPIDGELSLRNAIGQAAPGKSIEIDFIRNGQPMSVTVLVAAPPPTQTGAATPAAPSMKIGVTYRALTVSDRHELGMPPTTTGVLVSAVAPNSPADDAGLEQNDVIESVNGKPITTTAEADTDLSNLQPGSQQTLVVLRSTDGNLQEIAMDLKM